MKKMWRIVDQHKPQTGMTSTQIDSGVSYMVVHWHNNTKSYLPMHRFKNELMDNGKRRYIAKNV